MTSSWLRKGAVAYGHREETIPPKNKMIVLVGLAGDDLKIIYINSRINDFKRSHPQYRDRNVPVDPSDYPFLKRLSYIDCSSVYTISLEKLAHKILHNDHKIYGFLNSVHLSRVIEEVTCAYTVSAADKKIVATEFKF